MVQVFWKRCLETANHNTQAPEKLFNVVLKAAASPFYYWQQENTILRPLLGNSPSLISNRTEKMASHWLRHSMVLLFSCNTMNKKYYNSSEPNLEWRVAYAQRTLCSILFLYEITGIFDVFEPSREFIFCRKKSENSNNRLNSTLAKPTNTIQTKLC